MRFTLRVAFSSITFIGILLGLSVGLPQALSLFIFQLLTISDCGIFVTLAIFGTSTLRAFAIGAAVPQVFMCLTYSAVGYADILTRWELYDSMSINRWIMMMPWIHSVLLGGASAVCAHYCQWDPKCGR